MSRSIYIWVFGTNSISSLSSCSSSRPTLDIERFLPASGVTLDTVPTASCPQLRRLCPGSRQIVHVLDEDDGVGAVDAKSISTCCDSSKWDGSRCDERRNCVTADGVGAMDFGRFREPLGRPLVRTG